MAEASMLLSQAGTLPLNQIVFRWPGLPQQFR